MTKLNYLFSLLCMLAISTFAFAQPANDLCTNAIDLSSSLAQGPGNAINAGTFTNAGATVGADDPSTGFECFGEPDGGGATPSLENTVWFAITGDGNQYSFEATITGCTVSDGIETNDTQIAVYTGGCATLTPVACNEDGPNGSSGSSYPSLVEFMTEAGTEYLIMVDGFSFNGANSDGEFCMFITQTSGFAIPANDLCVDAIDLTASLGQGEGSVTNAGTFTNMAATTSDDPDIGFECFGEPDGGGAMPSLDRTVWFKMTGDGNDYGIEATITGCNVSDAIDFNDTQMVVYTGSCDALTSVTCNDDGPNAVMGDFPSFVEFTAEAGTEYLIMVDGFNFNGSISDGEFCMFITQQTSVSVLEVNEDVLGMTVFPNPVQDLLNLNINVADYSEATIMISNVAGQMVQQQIVNLQNGDNVLNINLDNAPAGVYMVSVETSSHQAVSRFIKQ